MTLSKNAKIFDMLLNIFLWAYFSKIALGYVVGPQKYDNTKIIAFLKKITMSHQFKNYPLWSKINLN